MLTNEYISDVYLLAPCKKCTSETGRKPGCHSKCEKYISYKAAMEEKRELVRKAKEEYRPVSIRKRKSIRMKGAKHGEV